MYKNVVSGLALSHLVNQQRLCFSVLFIFCRSVTKVQFLNRTQKNKFFLIFYDMYLSSFWCFVTFLKNKILFSWQNALQIDMKKMIFVFLKNVKNVKCFTVHHQNTCFLCFSYFFMFFVFLGNLSVRWWFHNISG